MIRPLRGQSKFSDRPTNRASSCRYTMFEHLSPGRLSEVRVNRIPAFVVLVFAMALVACGDNPINPSNEPEVTNAINDFRFQVTNISNLSRNLEYTWRNTGTIANVNQSSSVTSGTVALTIRDANGAMVYTRNLSENGTFRTSAGAAGNWRIEVAPANADGTLNFRVQRGG